MRDKPAAMRGGDQADNLSETRSKLARQPNRGASLLLNDEQHRIFRLDLGARGSGRVSLRAAAQHAFLPSRFAAFQMILV